MKSDLRQRRRDRRVRIAVAWVAGYYLAVLGAAGFLSLAGYGLYAHLGQFRDASMGLVEGAVFTILALNLPPLFSPAPRGARLNPKRQPELFASLANVARAANREMPVRVILTDQTNAFARRVEGFFGIGRGWTMGIGLPLIQAVTISELEATMAHEFGHFELTNMRLVNWLAFHHSWIDAKGRLGFRPEVLARPYRWHSRAFLRLQHKMLRKREFDADRTAACAVGSDAIIGSLRTIRHSSTVGLLYCMDDIATIAHKGYFPPFVEGLAAMLARPSVISSMDEKLAEDLAAKQTEYDDTHPPLAQRIAAVEGLPRAKSLDNRPALSLLRDLPSLEYRMITTTNRKWRLKPIAWADVAEKVWLPTCKKAVKEYSWRLKGCRLTTVAALARGPYSNAHVGAALACSLSRSGWTLESGPGIRRFRKGDIALDPFETVRALSAGNVTNEEWDFRLAALALDPRMPLYPG